MHLILGVDESPCSQAAADFVRGMTWPPGTTATVVYAVPPVALVAPEAYMVMAAEIEDVRVEQRVVHQRHAGAVAAGLSAAGLPSQALAPDGDPRVALLDAARGERADLVVVGSHGRTGIGKFLLGSVASHVTTHAPCSVLVVRDGRKGGGS
jgi:nucleotide-binding universal stress UspA family protein